MMEMTKFWCNTPHFIDTKFPRKEYAGLVNYISIETRACSLSCVNFKSKLMKHIVLAHVLSTRSMHFYVYIARENIEFYSAVDIPCEVICLDFIDIHITQTNITNIYISTSLWKNLDSIKHKSLQIN